MTNATTVSPYYDDFDEDKQFVRHLFRPSRAVQARELTQLQTILQNQITRFGQNIFKDGSVVIPGYASIDTNYQYVKLLNGTNYADLEVGEIITSGSTSAILLEKQTLAGDYTHYTLYVYYIAGGAFSADDSITGATSGVTVTVAGSGVTPIGTGTRVVLDKGIYFVNGYFAAAIYQSLIISPYSTPSGTQEIGLTPSTTIVTSDDDSSLLDPANGTNNKNAPGADRLKVALTLTKKSDILDSAGEFTDDYFTIITLKDAEIVESITDSTYNILGDEMARRTYEESGHYTIDPFIISPANKDADELTLTFDAGKAYVRGYEVRKALSTSLDINKAQTTDTRNSAIVSGIYGNYIRVQGSSFTGLPNIATLEQVNILNSGSTIIGTCRIRNIVKESGNFYRVYVTEVSMGVNNFADARFLDDTADLTYRIVGPDDAVLTGGDIAQIYGADNNDMLFRLPDARVSTVKDPLVTVRKYYSGTTNGSGVLTISTGNAQHTFVNANDWIVVTTAGGVVVSPTISPASSSATLSGLSVATNYEVLAWVQKTTVSTTDTGARAKNPTAAQISETSPGTSDITTDDIDVYRFVAIDKDVAPSGATYYSVATLTNRDALTPSANDICAVLANSTLSAPVVYKYSGSAWEVYDDATITNRYTLDTGQRDNYYTTAKFVYNASTPAPTGDVQIAYMYFQHTTSSGFFFSVDSYAGVDYDEIPTYTLANGQTIRLADHLDFRPRKDYDDGDYDGDDSGGAYVFDVPDPNGIMNVDETYYLPRVDILYIDEYGTFGTVQGIPSLNPKAPRVPAGVMPLYEMRLNAYTLDENDISLKFIENRRYTMRDIGRIESRVSRIEEWSTLSLLESNTDSLQVLDNAGNNRFKSGFFVDSFVDHSFADFGNANYQASIDPVAGICRPSFIENNTRLKYFATGSTSSASSTNVVQKGDLLMLGYTHAEEISQPLCSSSVNVNPYSVFTFTGSVEISPQSDEWRDVVTTTRRVTDQQNGNNVNPIQTNNWDNWSWNWGGIGRTEGGGDADSGWTNLVRVNQPLTRFGEPAQTLGGIRSRTDTRVVSVVLLPFIRSRRVYFRAQGLLPDTVHTPFFDGTNVSEWCDDASFINASTESTQIDPTITQNLTAHPDGSATLTSDANGKIEGSFYIPNNDTIRFRAGEREFKLLETAAGSSDSAALSRAYGSYYAQGTLEIRETTITTILPPRQDPPGYIRRIDPVAQSFSIERNEGAFISKVDLFFRTAATVEVGIPVRIQVRPVVNGIPSSELIEGSEVWVNPGDVNTSNDGRTATTFEFTAPIYLDGFREYAIVVLSDCDDYEVWTAAMAEFAIAAGGSVSSRRITHQPSLGSFFKSQNGTTWTPDQTRDLTFVIHRAVFQTSGTAEFDSLPIPPTLIPGNPFTTTNADATVNVLHPNHGLITNDTYTIAGATANNNGISAANLNGARTVTVVDVDNFTVEAGANATSTGRCGGTGVTGIPNYKYSIAYLNENAIELPNTGIGWSMITESGRSLDPVAPGETAYVQSTRTPVFSNRNIEFNTLRVLPSTANEVNSARGILARATFTSNTNLLSPVLDLSRLSMNLIHNRIRNTVASENSVSSGTSPAKHIFRPVTIETPGIGLKVLFGANKPSGTTIDLYYRTLNAGNGGAIADQPWVLATIDQVIPTNDNPDLYYEHEYTIDGLDAFTVFAFKIVFRSTNEAKVPNLRDFRAIAMST